LCAQAYLFPHLANSLLQIQPPMAHCAFLDKRARGPRSSPAPCAPRMSLAEARRDRTPKRPCAVGS
ncbi:unnamed protein product, partial [Urochloa humidicola]